MKTTKPIQASSTYRIINNVLPSTFKIANDVTSNGYKFINLLYGAEFDQVSLKMSEVYSNFFLSTLDLSDTGELYQVIISGVPSNQYLYSELGPSGIFITDDYNFYNGDPTRLIYNSGNNIPILSIGSGFIGLEYLRNDPRGSGYFLINRDIDQIQGYPTGIYPSYRINMDNVGNPVTQTGFYTGIISSNYTTNQFDEILTPLTSDQLKQNYPQYRTIYVTPDNLPADDTNGMPVQIDYYQPYLGWVVNQSGLVVANTSQYVGDYAFDENGNKVFYRTYLNNPYGTGNYNSVYLSLNNVPISGTLRLYDVDILDGSGNATEIYQSGRILYKKDSNLDSITYVGYDTSVPINQGFASDIVGSGSDYFDTISWDYVTEGSSLNQDSLVWNNISGAPITNMIRINNAHSRYVVEYQYKLYDKVICISSPLASRFIRLDSNNVINSTRSPTTAFQQIDYSFTRDLRYINDATYKRYLTFDGYQIRPGSFLSKVDLNLPIILNQGPLTNYQDLTSMYNGIGYSDVYVPSINSKKNVLYDVYFEDSSLSSYGMTYTSNSGSLSSTINFGTYLGKKINYNGGDSYYSLPASGYLVDNLFYYFELKQTRHQDLTLLEMYDPNNIYETYQKINLTSDGHVAIFGSIRDTTNPNCCRYLSRDSLTYNNGIKKIIVQYQYNLSSVYPAYYIYLNDGQSFKLSSTIFNQYSGVVNPTDSTKIKLFSNSSLEVSRFKVYTEVR